MIPKIETCEGISIESRIMRLRKFAGTMIKKGVDIKEVDSTVRKVLHTIVDHSIVIEPKF